VCIKSGKKELKDVIDWIKYKSGLKAELGDDIPRLLDIGPKICLINTLGKTSCGSQPLVVIWKLKYVTLEKEIYGLGKIRRKLLSV
jgi:hypothetical protein